MYRHDLISLIMDIHNGKLISNYDECNYLKFQCYNILTGHEQMTALDNIVQYSGCPNKTAVVVPYDYYDPTEATVTLRGWSINMDSHDHVWKN